MARGVWPLAITLSHRVLQGCDPVYNRRIYAAQSHFDAHLLHDDYIRTPHPERALLYYVPVFLNQRVTWGAYLNQSMLPALEYIRTRYPYWNASGGACGPTQRRRHTWPLESHLRLVKMPLLNQGVLSGANQSKHIRSDTPSSSAP